MIRTFKGYVQFHLTHTDDESLWREAPDIVNKSFNVIVSQTYPSNNIRLSLKRSYMFS